MITWLLALFALVCGLALLFNIPLGDLSPHLAGIGITALALALLIGPAVGYVRGHAVRP